MRWKVNTWIWLGVALAAGGCGDNIVSDIAGDAGADAPIVDGTAPTISEVADQTMDEDTAVTGIAFTVGDAEVAAETLTVTASSSDADVIADGGLTLSGSGAGRTLDITPVSNGNGAATVTLTVSDGVNTASTSFTVTVNPVNDPPTVTDIADVTLDEDSATGALAFTIADVEDAAGALAVSVESSDSALVPAAGITLGGAGASRTVAIAPAADASGTATITVTVTDSGAASTADTFLLTVSAVNDPPVAAADQFLGGSGTTGNVQLVVTGSVLDNDSDVDGPALTVTPVSGTGNTAQGGDVSIAAAGTFVYTPALGFLGTDTFTYTVNDNDAGDPRSATGTVTIQVSAPMTWFVDNSAPGPGDGRDGSPFARLRDVETAPVTGNGDIIRVARGDGTSNNQNQGITLRDNQRLLGDVLPAPPVITNAGGDAVTLADGNTVMSVIIDSPAGRGIVASGVAGAANIVSVLVGNTGGDGIALQNSPSAAFTFESVVVSANGRGLAADNAGALSVAQTTVSAAGAAIDIQNSALSSVAFDSVASTNGSGDGVRLRDNTGAVTLRSLSVTNTGGTGLLARNTGTLTISGSGNTVDTTGGTAVDIAGTTLGVTLRRASASGGGTGIALSNTGGSFTVTGDGSDARNGSGGIIQNMSGRGINLTGASNVTLRSMTIQNTGSDGILGSGVTGFTLRGGSLSGTGDAVTEHGIEFRGLFGNATIANTEVAGAFEDAVRLFNDSGTLSALAVSNSIFRDNNAALGNAGLNLESRGSARMDNITITGSTFSGLSASAVVAGATASSFLRVAAGGSTFVNSNIAWQMQTSGAGILEFDLSNNLSINGHDSHAVNVFSATTTTGGSITGTIASNVIGTAGAGGSGSSMGNGIRININGQSRATIAVTGNTIQEIEISRGIEAEARLGGGGLDLTLADNTVRVNPDLGLAGILVKANDGNSVCANIQGNSSVGGPFFPGPFGGAYIVGEGDVSPGVVRLQGFMTDVATTLGNNGNTGTPVSQFGSNIAAPAGPCALP